VKNNTVKVLLIYVLTTFHAYSQISDDHLSVWLKDNVYEVDNLEPNNLNFNQFGALETAIGDRNIVLLGEQTHGDGTTFQAKVRLVKFLHQKLGFETLVFENGFYQSFKLWEELQNGMDYQRSVPKGIHERWANVHQVQPIFSYIKNSVETSSPLKLMGMDILFDGSYAKNTLITDFDCFLSFHYYELSKSADYIFFKTEMYKFLTNQTYRPSPDTLKSFTAILDNYIEILSLKISENDWDTDGFWSQVLSNFKVDLSNNLGRRNGSYSRTDFFNNRDRMMADNVAWVLKENKKIIIWTSVTHNMRDVEDELLDQMGWSTDTRFMGEYLRGLVGPDKMFHISFTGYTGFYTDIYRQKVEKFNPPSLDSLETLLNNNGSDYKYLILNGDALPSVLNQPIKASFIFNQEYSANWTKSIDAVFFTRCMSPSVNKKLGKAQSADN